MTIFAGSAGVRAQGLDLRHQFLALDDFAKDHVRSVQPRCEHRGDEELRAIALGAGDCVRNPDILAQA